MKIEKIVGTVFLQLYAVLAFAQFPYQDTRLTAEKRAEDLLQRLTLQEKVGLMQNNSKAVPRLGIQPYEWWNEALHGVARAGLATVFPQAIGMAASFDDSLVYAVFDAVSDEARIKNRKFREQGQYKRYQGLTFWTPNVNIFRDPRWGRGQETYGEDPFLASRMGIAVVRGLQGAEGEKYDKAHACAKHFAVHSGPEWNRHHFNAEDIDLRDLYETYLPAFKALVQKANVKEVMCAYNRFEGEPCCGSEQLLHQILRREWGFQGIVVSDCGAINDFFNDKGHHTHPNGEHAAAAAVTTGTDLECGSVYANLAEAVKKGLISEERINTSVKRLLKARFELGEMDATTPWDTIPAALLAGNRHAGLALEMAHKSLVLLQNKGNLLPLSKGTKVAVMGPAAVDSVMQWGNYNGFPAHTVTLLEAVCSKLSAEQVIYEPGCDRISEKTLHSLFQECAFQGKRGFQATYWNNKTFSGQHVATDQLAEPFHFSAAGATAFAPGVNTTDFSAEYQTVFVPSASGEVVFQMLVYGTYALYMNDSLVAQGDDLRNLPAIVYRLQTQKGKEYRIRLKYNHRKGDAVLYFNLGRELPVDLAAVVERVREAEVVIFAGGISPNLEGEEMRNSQPGFKGGDRTDIEVPAIQRKLLAALKAAGKKVVLVNYSGSAMGLAPETESCDAILQAWYPGQAGGTAVADVLWGDYNPAGRLAVTFYKNVNQLPDFEDYSMKNRTYRFLTQQPLFPFGYGLSYTTFEYGQAQWQGNRLVVPVKNVGKYNGEEVVQIYLRRPEDPEGPRKTLRAFRRVFIPAGETIEVEFTLEEEAFEWWDRKTGTVRSLPGKYELYYGGDSSTDRKIEVTTRERK